MSDAPPAAPVLRPRKRGRKKTLFAAIGALLLIGVAGGVWWTRASTPPESPKPAVPASESARGIIALEPFLVNLADRDASRFLRVTLRLVVPEEEDAKKIAEDHVSMTRVRSAILEILTTQTADRVITPEGKAELKKAIAERTSAIVGETQVVDVLFSDFVVQF